MPSGAKRRKAARKKKEKETQNVKSSSDDNPQGNNDGNSQDERGSDGGDVGSTASQEHDNSQDQFKERNEELRKSGLPSTRPDVSEETSVKGVLTDGEDFQTVGLKDDGGVRIERELKEDSTSENVIVGHADSAKRSYNGDNRSSSSSSSDEESQVVERRLKEDAYASVSEEKSHKDLIISVNSLAPEVFQTTGDAPPGKTTSSVAEAAAFSDSVQHEVSVNPTESTVVESLVTSNDAVRRGFENGAQKVLPTGAPSTLSHPVSKKVEDRASPLLKETAQVSVAESVPKENESQVLPSSSILDQVSNNADSIKEPEIPEYSEKQPLLAPPPQVTQKTSWFSCCGILDVFTGSGR